MRKTSLFVLPLVLSLAALPVLGQWVGYPTANVPRKADGTVDMHGPTPRLSDGKPDLSGIWVPSSPNRQENGEDLVSDGNDITTSPHMANIGVDMPGGLPYQDWQLPIVKERTENLAIDDPHIRCLPDNFLRAYGLPHMLKYVHTEGLWLTLNEMNAGYRQVFTDARALPEEPNPSWQGYSTAKWEGDTLVVDTIGLRDDIWIDWNGSVVTEAAHIREEISRPDFGHIIIKATVDDPKAYKMPWTVTLKQRIVVDAELIDEICLENEQFVRLMGLEGSEDDAASAP